MTRITRSQAKLSFNSNATLDKLAVQRKPRLRAASKKLESTPPITFEKCSRHVRAIDKLRASMPESIPCRDREAILIKRFIDSCIQSGQGASLYITGSPGTGKTITVSSCLNAYRSPKTVINAMALPNSQSLYQKLHDAFIGGDIISSNCCLNRLSKLFKRQHGAYIVVVDEFDGLMTSNQEVLYQLFNWAHAPNSNLILIGIANAAELTDRCLPLLAQHNIFPERLAFPPYNYSQLGEILASRLQGDKDLFHPFAAELLARRVAGSSSGDARKFLDLCRNAVVCSEFSGSDIVAIPNVTQVLNTALDSGVVQRVQALPSQQQIVLSLLILMLTGQRGSTTVGAFRVWYAKETKRQSLPTVRSTDFVPILRSLNSMGLIDIKNNRKSNEDSVITARVQKDDLKFALKDVHFFATLLQSDLK